MSIVSNQTENNADMIHDYKTNYCAPIQIVDHLELRL